MFCVSVCVNFAGSSGTAGAAVSGHLPHGLLCQWKSWSLDCQ